MKSYNGLFKTEMATSTVDSEFKYTAVLTPLADQVTKLFATKKPSVVVSEEEIDSQESGRRKTEEPDIKLNEEISVQRLNREINDMFSKTASSKKFANSKRFTHKPTREPMRFVFNSQSSE